MGTPTVVPSIGGSVPIDNVGYQVRPVLRAVGDTVYFTRMVDTSFLNGIYKYRKGDTAPTQVLSANRVASFLVDDDAIYVLKVNENGVWKAPRAGGALVEISSQGGAKLVGQDDEAVYLLDAFSGTSNLYKVLK